MNQQNNDDLILLIIACKENNKDLVKYLISLNSNTKDNNSILLLHICLCR